MAKLYNLAGMTTATTGTGTITLGSAMSGHLTFAQAGVQDGETVTYAIQDGDSSEIGRGVYTSSGTTLTRTVLRSTNSNSAISLSGTAEVVITASAEDFDRAVLCDCRLNYVSTTSIRLDRLGGSYLFINGTNESIQSAGVTVSNSGVSAGTLYYAYAYMNSGTMTLELSTTTHVTDSTYGHQVKSGDATRTLVGMCYGDTGGVFADTAAKRYVLSYYNRKALSVTVSPSGNQDITSAPWVEINSDSRTQFLSWGETVTISTVILASNTAGVAIYGSVGLGTTVGTYSGGYIGIYGVSGVTGYVANLSASGPAAVGAGFNCATLMGGRDSGTATYGSGYRKYYITIQG